MLRKLADPFEAFAGSEPSYRSQINKEKTMALPRKRHGTSSNPPTHKAILILFFPFLLTLCVFFIFIPGPHNYSCRMNGSSLIEKDWSMVSILDLRSCQSAEVRKAIPYLFKGLDIKRDVRMRMFSSHTLARCKIKGAAKAITQQLKNDPSPDVKAKAVSSLKRLGPLAAPAIPYILKEYYNPSVKRKPWLHQQLCLEALRSIGSKAIPALASIIAKGHRHEVLRQVGYLFQENPELRKESLPIYQAMGKLLKKMPESYKKRLLVKDRKKLGYHLRVSGILRKTK